MDEERPQRNEGINFTRVESSDENPPVQEGGCLYNCKNVVNNDEYRECMGWSLTCIITTICVCLITTFAVAQTFNFKIEELQNFPIITGKISFTDTDNIFTILNEAEIPFGKDSILLNISGELMVKIIHGDEMNPKEIWCYDVSRNKSIRCKNPIELFNNNEGDVYLDFYKSKKYGYMVGEKCYITKILDYAIIKCNEFYPSELEGHINFLSNFSYYSLRIITTVWIFGTCIVLAIRRRQ